MLRPPKPADLSTIIIRFETWRVKVDIYANSTATNILSIFEAQVCAKEDAYMVDESRLECQQDPNSLLISEEQRTTDCPNDEEVKLMLLGIGLSKSQKRHARKCGFCIALLQELAAAKQTSQVLPAWKIELAQLASSL